MLPMPTLASLSPIYEVFKVVRKTRDELGRAFPLYPGTSDLNLFGNFKSIINLDAEIPHRALDFGVAK